MMFGGEEVWGRQGVGLGRISPGGRTRRKQGLGARKDGPGSIRADYTGMIRQPGQGSKLG
jgi:hypothetical protein